MINESSELDNQANRLPMNIFPEIQTPTQSNDQRFWIDWFYHFGKASYVLRIIDYLQAMKRRQSLQVEFITIVHQPQGWIVRIRPSQSWPLESILNIQALMNELGNPTEPNRYIRPVFNALEQGQSLSYVRNHYCISVIDHGLPKPGEVLTFCEQVISEFGYCPESVQ